MTTAPPPRAVTRLFFAVFAVSLAMMGLLLFELLTSVVLSLVLVSIFWPVYQWMLDKTKGRAPLASGLTTTLVVLLVGVPVGLFISALSGQAWDLYEQTQQTDFLDEVTSFFSGEGTLAVQLRSAAAELGIDLSPARLKDLTAEGAKSVAVLLSEQVGGMAGNVLAIVVDVGLIIVIVATLFLHGERLRDYLFDLSPLPDVQEERLTDRFADVAKAVILGNGVASLLQGFFGGLGFSLFGLGSGAFWGAGIAFFAFLPIVGASVVVVPAFIFLIIQGRYGAAIGFAVYNFIYILIFEYWLKTKLASGGVNSVLVFLGIVGGLSLWGPLGLFYGPLIVAMFLTLAEMYKDSYRGELKNWVSQVPTPVGEPQVTVADEARAPDDAGAGPSKPEASS